MGWWLVTWLTSVVGEQTLCNYVTVEHDLFLGLDVATDFDSLLNRGWRCFTDRGAEWLVLVFDWADP